MMKRTILALAAILAVGGSALAQDDTTIIRRHHSGDYQNDGRDMGATVRMRRDRSDDGDDGGSFRVRRASRYANGYDGGSVRIHRDMGRHYGWRQHRTESYGMARRCRPITIERDDMVKRIRKCS